MKALGIEYGGQGDDGGLTFAIVDGAQAGDAVTLTAAATMGRGVDGGIFGGKLMKVEKDGRGTVNRHGVLVVPCVAGLTVGQKGLVVDGAGKVREGAAGVGRQGLVITVQDGLAATEFD